MSEKIHKEKLKKLLEEIEILRQQATRRGLSFSSPTTKQLEKKLKSTHTPFISGMSWNHIGSAISTFPYYIYVYNPDPDTYSNLFAYFFFGPANMVQDVGTALHSIDERLYRGFAEFPSVSSGSTTSVQFNYRFPSGTPLGLYMGNSFVFMRDYHDVGIYIDRGCINVEIT
jgi:hypothetical protein